MRVILRVDRATGRTTSLFSLHLFLFFFFINFLAQALIEMGEAMKQMADVKYSLDDNIKQNFLEPLHHLQTKDLKEVMVRLLEKLRVLALCWGERCLLLFHLAGVSGARSHPLSFF